MSNILNSEDFGTKIYNRFPSKYREDDVGQQLALKRYIESLSDGGFSPVIQDMNGLLDIKDTSRTPYDALLNLYKQYGLEVFNGIPEPYLRYLLPRLSEAWSKKGSLSVIEFVTSSLSGIKTSTNVTYDSKGNPFLEVRLEMDYNMGDYFPDSKQFNRILRNFIPFYCDFVLLYTYMFYESGSIFAKDLEAGFNIKDTKDEVGGIEGDIVENMSVTNNVQDSGTVKNPLDLTLLNGNRTLSNDFYTNDMCCYDIITVGSEQFIKYN